MPLEIKTKPIGVKGENCFCLLSAGFYLTFRKVVEEINEETKEKLHLSVKQLERDLIR